MREIMLLADRANQYVDTRKPWAIAKAPARAAEVGAAWVDRIGQQFARIDEVGVGFVEKQQRVVRQRGGEPFDLAASRKRPARIVGIGEIHDFGALAVRGFGQRVEIHRSVVAVRHYRQVPRMTAHVIVEGRIRTARRDRGRY